MNFYEFTILLENKQEIITLGFPKVIADIIYKHFGKNAYQIAKWNKDYHNGSGDRWWFEKNSFFGRSDVSLGDYVRIYNAQSIEEYEKIWSDIHYNSDPIKIDDENELQEQKEWLKRRIEEKLLDSTFFSYLSLIEDIKTGKLQDLAPYKKLSYEQAQDKYDKKNIFKDVKPLKVYENGWKWINIGKKCNLIGKMMKNCGSSGLMSDDEDRTIIALFDKGNKPHAMVTYSPNQKRISGDEGIASSQVKDKYSDYVLDLANFLNVELKSRDRISKSKLLSLKYKFRDDLLDIKRLNKPDIYAEYFLIILKNGKEYYSDGNQIVEKEKIDNLIKTGSVLKGYGIPEEGKQLKSYKDAFNMYLQKPIKEKGIEYQRV